jgi:hypothetical protein
MSTFNCFYNLTFIPFFLPTRPVKTDGRKHDRKNAREPILTAVMKRKTDTLVKKGGTRYLHFPEGTETSKEGGGCYEKQ